MGKGGGSLLRHGGRNMYPGKELWERAARENK